MPFETLQKVFVEQIKSCKGMVVTAMPFDGPLVAKRMWCLFEAVMATIHDIPITVVLPKSEETRLRERIKRIFDPHDDMMVAVMQGIDSRKAEATMREDLENIRRLIETQVSGGYGAVDEIFKGVIRQWVVGLLSKLMGTFKEGSLDQGSFAQKAGIIMHRGAGYYEDAIIFFTISLEIILKIHGPEHPAVATDLNNLAGLLKKQVRL